MQELVVNGRIASRPSLAFWLGVGVFLLLMGYVFQDGLARMTREWQNPEYGHSYFIPLISLFLIWQKRFVLQTLPWQPSWTGVLIVAAGLALSLIGELATLFVIVQYAFLITLFGAVLALTGWRVTRALWAPLLFLVFMVPLPDFLYHQLSTRLQLVSSELGAAIIQAFGISVLVEGNVIDLGAYQLQVVEACNGLRYLFPLMTIAFIAAYFFRASLWKKAVIFAASVPIAILMNSFRIGVIGLLVEFSGTGAAEGFLHFFEGWVVFMLCIGILLGGMALLGRVGPDPQPLRALFTIQTEPAPAGSRALASPQLNAPFAVALALLALTAIGLPMMKGRQEVPLPRASFINFPMELGAWKGEHDRLEKMYIDFLKFDDYLLADYAIGRSDHVNLYIAYYASQRKGQSAHSPRTCIPGGGWEISKLSTITIPPATAADAPFNVNRLVIQRGRERQLVYYWFKERDRFVTNEYAVKALLFWDALTRNRTDGALIRLTAYVEPNANIEDIDRRMAEFARLVERNIRTFVPD